MKPTDILFKVAVEFYGGDSAEQHVVANHLHDCLANIEDDGDTTPQEAFDHTMKSMEELRLAVVNAIARINEIKKANQDTQ